MVAHHLDHMVLDRLCTRVVWIRSLLGHPPPCRIGLSAAPHDFDVTHTPVGIHTHDSERLITRDCMSLLRCQPLSLQPRPHVSASRVPLAVALAHSDPTDGRAGTDQHTTTHAQGRGRQHSDDRSAGCSGRSRLDHCDCRCRCRRSSPSGRRHGWTDARLVHLRRVMRVYAHMRNSICGQRMVRWKKRSETHTQCIGDASRCAALGPL